MVKAEEFLNSWDQRRTSTASEEAVALDAPLLTSRDSPAGRMYKVLPGMALPALVMTALALPAPVLQ